MKFEKRTIKKTGESYFSFVRYDPQDKKAARMTRDEIRNRFGRDIVSIEDATKCLGMLEAEVDSTKQRYQKRQDWQDKFYRFSELLRIYRIKRQKKAPNSWRNNCLYLNYYVLPFFLNNRQLENILLWPDHYEAFRNWLETDAYLVRKPEQRISYASMNHCVKALNTFMRHLKDDGVITELRLMEAFDESLLKERTADDLIAESDMESIISHLRSVGNGLEGDYYRFLYFTGMRFNEALGVSLSDVHPGQSEHGLFSNLLQKNHILYYGFIVLDSQPAAENRAARDIETGRVPRKPLKGRKKICEKNSRIVPITDRDVWNNLVMRCREQFQNWKTGFHGTDQKDYLLFDGINKSTSMTRLKQAHEGLNLGHKTWHCLRHTRGTMLFGQTGDRELAKMWLGHSSCRVFEKYNHTFQEVVRKSKRPVVKREGDFESWFS
jgi:integrase